MKDSPGNYLVYVKCPEGLDGNNTCALEWNEGKGWSKTQKKGARWHEGADVDQAFHPSDREGLLGHFGLWDWQEEFPWDKILNMSPKDLINARREKEKKDRHLKKHEAFRSGCTERYLAEDFS